MFYITMHCFHLYALFPSNCQLVIPIDLRAAKALPRNCGHKLLVGRRTPGEGGLIKYYKLRMQTVLRQRAKEVLSKFNCHSGPLKANLDL